MKLAIIPAILVANLAATIATPVSFDLPWKKKEKLQFGSPGPNILTNSDDRTPRNENYSQKKPQAFPASPSAGKIPNLMKDNWLPDATLSLKTGKLKVKGPKPHLFDDDTLGKVEPVNKSGSSLKIQDAEGLRRDGNEENTVPSLAKVPKRDLRRDGNEENTVPDIAKDVRKPVTQK